MAIQRIPARAARLRELEVEVAAPIDRPELNSALAEISEIMTSARLEAIGE